MTDVLLPAEDLLTAAEEIELARRMEVGTVAAAALAGELPAGSASTGELEMLVHEGVAARERYVLANVRLVAMVAHSAARRSGLGFADLFQEGIGGLICAVDRFDHRHNVRFATYALPWIRAQVAKVVATRCGSVPLSEHRAERRRTLCAVADRMSQTLGRQVTAADVAGEVGQDVAAVAELLAVEPPIGLVDDSGAVIDPPDPRALHALEQVGVATPEIGAWLGALPVIERRVVGLRFGFAGASHSFAGIADVLGVSKSTVRRIEARALERLRDICSTEHLPLAG
ncbi:sigma-70 family RNA polymerase sigma factor [Granulicoccus sp. GXG6511]|uniref:sigma-70 family RNA polymerase sigma factor n=1 Tax=Granulicoccus sp. GXG6511 TaxID=3381351 RepID=UPI003D7E0BBF